MREGGSAVRRGVLALVLAGSVGLQPRVERTERTPPPKDVGSALRGAVRSDSIAIELASGGTLRVWPARRVRAAGPAPAGESAFVRERLQLSIEPGSLVALASWDSPWTDYRGQRIPAGLYALVYAIQPQFKPHRGVSEFRDAVLLVPPAAGRLGHNLAALVEASRAVSGTSHPAVAALFPVDPGVALPRLWVRANGGSTLDFVAGAFRIGLAVTGTGRIDKTNDVAKKVSNTFRLFSTTWHASNPR